VAGARFATIAVTSDALGRTGTLPTPPRRIVSLVPSQTELLADLGLDAEVVGLTRFCVHPDGWKARKRIVGGTKNVRLDRVAALNPDLILANKEENEREQVEALTEIAPVYVTDVATVAGALALIRAVGALVGRAARAQALAREVEAGFAGLGAAEPIPVAYLIWRDPYMTVGGDTFISDVLARAGLINVFREQARYPEATLAGLREAGAEAVLLSSEPYPFRRDHAAEVEEASGLPTVLIDGELCSWYGSRMRRAAPYLADFRERLRETLRSKTSQA